MNKRWSRFLSVVLLVAMVMSLMPTTLAFAEETAARGTWELIEGSETVAPIEEAASYQTVAVTMEKDGAYWVLPAENTGKSPAAVSASVEGGFLITEGGAAEFGWEITETEGGYTLKNAAGEYLYIDEAATQNSKTKNAAVRVGETEAVWTVETVNEKDYLSSFDCNDAQRYLGVYNGQDWRDYTSVNNSIKDETLQLWVYADNAEPTPDPDPDPDPEEPNTVTLDKLTAAPADGTNLVVYHPASKTVLTASASGSKLAGTAAEPAEDKLVLGDEMAYLIAHEKEGVYTFELEGQYLTSGQTGNSLSFAADGTSDLARWTLEQQADGTWYIKNAGANYNGNYNQYLEYYNGFTTYGVKDNNAAYKFELYGIAAEPANADPVSGLKTGDKIAIFNDGNGKALTASASGSRLAAADATLGEDGKIAGEGIALLEVTVNDEGRLLFANEGKYLTSGPTGSSLSFTDEASEYSQWISEEAGEGLFYLKNASAAYNGTPQYLEYYNTFTTYKLGGGGKAYAMSFRQIAETQEPQPAGASYGLTSRLSDGDTVILYNAKSGMALGNSLSNYKVSGVALTPEAGVITTDNTAAAWKVTVNADGTVTFKQGDLTLGGTVRVSGDNTYNNIALTGATSTSWTLTGPDAADFSYFLSLDDMSGSFGKIYLEYYSGYTLYGSSTPNKDAFGIQFYKQGAEPEEPAVDKGDLITSLSELTDGATVAIYSPSHKTAISSKPNGDWYLKAQTATVQDGKVQNFSSDLVWQVKVNANGTYSFISNDDPSKSITVWPSGNYAEVTVNPREDGDNTWTLTPAKTKDCFYMSSPTISGANGPAYIEAYIRNDFEVYSGYFTQPSNSRFTESEFALQFYLVDPANAVAVMDDGEWDGVLNKGEQVVLYNVAAEASVGLFKEANYACDAVPTELCEDGTAKPGNGAYVFTVDSMGRYYTFQTNGKYLVTNNDEELGFLEPNEDGSAPETAKWFLYKKEGGYILYNKEASYNGTPVCIEYYSSVFSGWTYSTKNDLAIYLFNFYKPAEGTKIFEDVVQVPAVAFDCEDIRYVEQDYKVAFSLDDLAPEIRQLRIEFTAGEKTGTVTEFEKTEDGKAGEFTIPADQIDGETPADSLEITITVTNSYGIEYTGVKTVRILDEPFFTELTPRRNAQTDEELRPVISARIGNVGPEPSFTMLVNEEEVEARFSDGVLSYQPAEDLPLGRTTVKIIAVRKDGVRAEVSWNFITGYSLYQKYFGQLHSHTTYSDGSGSLDTALEYIAALPESANVQFVAFTDHSNYFDTTSAANPADALNDQSLMTDASRALWNQYKASVAGFNAAHNDLIAIAGFEMTWSGGPGHINTFDSDGLVSRNNADLNNKGGDAGMKLYYETINKGESLNQFNHPGSTFGNFTDFSYWNAETDAHMFLVEVGNGEGQIGEGGYYPSYEEYILALDKGWHLAPTNNQDNHKGRWGNANDARDVVLAESFSEQGIYDAIRNLRVYATEDKNLDIGYTVNDEVMGYIYPEGETPETMDVVVTLFDPDAGDRIVKVEMVVDGGKTAYVWDDAQEIAEGELSVSLTPEYSYYFVRVTQADGDLAVTAPVWTGISFKAGITAVKAEEKVYKGEQTTITTTLYNNTDAAVKVDSLTYTFNGSQLLGTDTKGYTIPANGTIDVSFTATFDKAKITTVNVKAVVSGGEKSKEDNRSVELDVIDRATENTVTPIAQVRAASVENDTGYRFVIEGVITSNASGYDKDTAFFDCIYVQDATGGLCCFPVSGEYKIGDKVRIVGHTDFYQAEPELQVQTIEIIGQGSVEPEAITAAQLNDRSAEGKLITLEGTVESFEVVNGLVQTIMVKDAQGDLGRVFIDGYITTEKEVKDLKEGGYISATGLASYDDTFNAPEGPFPRIRIRDRADVYCESEPTATVYGVNLSTGGFVSLSVYVSFNHMLQEAENLTITMDGKAVELGQPQTIGGKEYYGFSVNKAAPQMTETVTLRVLAGEEPVKLVSGTGTDFTAAGYTVSIADYIRGNAASSNEKLAQFMKAMAAYGHYTQLFLNYNTKALMEADQAFCAELEKLTAKDVAAYASTVANALGQDSLTYLGGSLVVDSATAYRQYFRVLKGSVSDYTFLLDGAEVTPISKNGSYYVELSNIPAALMGESHTLEVRDAGGSLINIDFCALSYVYSTLNSKTASESLKNAARSAYFYAMAAKEYFNR